MVFCQMSFSSPPRAASSLLFYLFCTPMNAKATITGATLLNFADDIVIVSLRSGDNPEHGPVERHFYELV